MSLNILPKCWNIAKSGNTAATAQSSSSSEEELWLAITEKAKNTHLLVWIRPNKLNWLLLIQLRQSSLIQTNKTGAQPYRDTAP